MNAMDPTQAMLTLIVTLGTVASASFTFILHGIRAQLTEHRAMLIDNGQAIARIEGARSVEKE